MSKNNSLYNSDFSISNDSNKSNEYEWYIIERNEQDNNLNDTDKEKSNNLL